MVVDPWGTVVAQASDTVGIVRAEIDPGRPATIRRQIPSLANRRLAFDRTRDRDIVGKLFEVLGPRYAARNGGYLRILKMGFRVGDNAPMAFVELVDRPEISEPSTEQKAD